MKIKRRTAAVILLALYLFITFSSVSFIMAEAHHDCTGENCPICREIHIVQAVLNNFSIVLGITAETVTFFGFGAIIYLLSFGNNYIGKNPVQLKVKLSE